MRVKEKARRIVGVLWAPDRGTVFHLPPRHQGLVHIHTRTQRDTDQRLTPQKRLPPFLFISLSSPKNTGRTQHTHVSAQRHRDQASTYCKHPSETLHRLQSVHAPLRELWAHARQTVVHLSCTSLFVRSYFCHYDLCVQVTNSTPHKLHAIQSQC